MGSRNAGQKTPSPGPSILTDLGEQSEPGALVGGGEASETLERFPDLSERTYGILQQEILTGRHAPGSELVIVELARRLGVSRSPVKHALARLCGEGLAQLIPGKGYFVSRLDEEQARHLLDARLALEVAAAERGVLLATETQLAAMRYLFDEMARLVTSEGRYMDFRQSMEKDHGFHTVLVATSGNPYLVRFHGLLHFHLFQMRIHFAVELGDKRAMVSVQEHQEILTAWELRSMPRAITAVRQHIHSIMISLGVEGPTSSS